MDDLLKFITPNWSAVEVICCILVLKGIGKMQDLTASIKDLSAVISKLQSQNDSVVQRLELFNNNLAALNVNLQSQNDSILRRIELYDNKLANVDSRLNSLEQLLRQVVG